MKKKLMLIIVVILLVAFMYTRYQSTSIAEYLENNGFDYNKIDEISVVQYGYDWNREEEIKIEIDGHDQAIKYFMTIKDIPLKKNGNLFKGNEIYWDYENSISFISVFVRNNKDSIRLIISNSEDGEINISLYKTDTLREVLYFSNFEDFIVEK